MRGDIVLEFFRDVGADNFGFVVRRAIVDAFIELEVVTGSASGGVFCGRHELAAGHGIVRRKDLRFRRQQLAFLGVTGFGGDIFCVAIIPLCLHA